MVLFRLARPDPVVRIYIEIDLLTWKKLDRRLTAVGDIVRQRECIGARREIGREPRARPALPDGDAVRINCRCVEAEPGIEYAQKPDPRPPGWP